MGRTVRPRRRVEGAAEAEGTDEAEGADEDVPQPRELFRGVDAEGPAVNVHRTLHLGEDLSIQTAMS